MVKTFNQARLSSLNRVWIVLSANDTDPTFQLSVMASKRRNSTELEPLNYFHELLHLQAIWVDNLIADGALHQHEVELVLLFSQGVFLPGFFAHQAHSSVGQNRLQRIEDIKVKNTHYSLRCNFRHKPYKA